MITLEAYEFGIELAERTGTSLKAVERRRRTYMFSFIEFFDPDRPGRGLITVLEIEFHAIALGVRDELVTNVRSHMDALINKHTNDQAAKDDFEELVADAVEELPLWARQSEPMD